MVQTEQQIAAVARLAREIWREHYTPIIGPAQVDYMLDRFQSEAAIADQIAQGFDYHLAEQGGRFVGYVAIGRELSDGALFLSKIYTRRSARGHGVGRTLLALAIREGRHRHAGKIRLTVNRRNNLSIAWYTRLGFKNVGVTVTDIGGGFVMDDYVMEKPLH